MHNSKFIDPRLVEREAMFEQLHMSIFETMNYARTIQQQVETTGLDIECDNPEYLQLLRDYQVTKNLSPIVNSQLEPLCATTDSILQQKDVAYANLAQLCAAAIGALNHWRILSEIPEDLRDIDDVTKALKDKFHNQSTIWECIVEDLYKTPRRFDT